MPLPKRFFIIIAGALLAVGLFLSRTVHGQDFSATTSVDISVCGNGIVEPPLEKCDDGVNDGFYATSSAKRNCLPDCSGYAPYCGDGILQQAFGEQCDDGNNVSGDGCSATCQIESLQPTPGASSGGGGGGGAYLGGSYSLPKQTQVVVQGKAYPGTSVNILDDGAPVGIVQADTSGNFYFSTTDVSPGVATFGFWAQDDVGMKSIALTTTFTITANAITTLSSEYLPPTISIDKRQVAQGDTLTISGQSVPNVTVETNFHSAGDIMVATGTDQSGNWKVAFDTTPLENNSFHTVNAIFVASDTNGEAQQSTLSQTLSFYVGSGNVGKAFTADLNHDGKVNLADFSILLYYWGTSSPIADLNSDGKVNLADFSILLYYWTG